jgi:hypothetical protein
MYQRLSAVAGRPLCLFEIRLFGLYSHKVEHWRMLRGGAMTDRESQDENRLRPIDDIRRRTAAALIAAGPDEDGRSRVETTTDLERALVAEVEGLQRVCAEAYQFAGAVGAPVRVLDQLWAAAEGRPLPHESILPVSAADCSAAPPT